MDKDIGIGIDRTPMTSPFQSRATAPIPAKLVSLKTAASKFTLTSPGSGRSHWCSTDGRGTGGSYSYATRKSCNRLLAREVIQDIGCDGRPKWRAFLMLHRHQAETAKSSFLKSSLICKTRLSKSHRNSGEGEKLLVGTNYEHSTHTSHPCTARMRVAHPQGCHCRFHKAPKLKYVAEKVGHCWKSIVVSSPNKMLDFVGHP